MNRRHRGVWVGAAAAALCGALARRLGRSAPWRARPLPRPRRRRGREQRRDRCPRPRRTFPPGTTALGRRPPDQVAAPRRGAGRAGPDRPGPGRGRGVDAGLARLPPLPHVRRSSPPSSDRAPSEVAPGVLRAAGRGSDRGHPSCRAASCCPSRGTAAAVSAGLRHPARVGAGSRRQARALVNTAAPQVPAALAGAVTGVIGLNGLAQEHSMLRTRRHDAGPHRATPPRPPGPSRPRRRPRDAGAGSGRSGAGPRRRGPCRHPQACPAAAGTAGGGSYTSTAVGLHLRARPAVRPGAHRDRPDHRRRRVRAVPPERLRDVRVLLRAGQLRSATSIVDGGAGRPAVGPGRGRPRHRDRRGQRALGLPGGLRGAEQPDRRVGPGPVQPHRQRRRCPGRHHELGQTASRSSGAGDVQTGEHDLRAHGRAGADGDRRVGRLGLGGLLLVPTATTTHRSRSTTPAPARRGRASGGTAMESASAASQVVWNDCYNASDGMDIAGCSASNAGAGGGGYSSQWPLNPGQSTPPGFPGPAGHRPVPQSGRVPCPCPTSRIRPTPTAGSVVAYSSYDGGWTAFGGTSIAAPTSAGLFADTNQGCYAAPRERRPRPLRQRQRARTSSTSPRATTTSPTRMAASSPPAPATTPPAVWAAPSTRTCPLALQGADGCPSVASVSPNTGPISGGGAVTISGGGFANATSVTFGSVGTGARSSPGPPPPSRSSRRAPRTAVRRRHRYEFAGRLGDVGRGPVRLRR